MIALRIRNRSLVFKASCAIHAQYRWCLTGTPIQNSLDDYGALLSFLDVPPFKEKSQFDHWIATPLKHERTYCSQRIKDLIAATCLRRTKAMVGDSCGLPKRTERVEMLEFHEQDQALYDFFKHKGAKLTQGMSVTKPGLSGAEQRKEDNILSLIHFLRLICNHGEQILPEPALKAWEARDDASINWRMIQSCRKRCCLCKIVVDDTDLLATNGYRLRCHHSLCPACTSQIENTSEEEGWCPKCAKSFIPGEDSSVLSPSDSSCPPPSAKVEALLRNLRAEQAIEPVQGSSNPIKRSLIRSYQYYIIVHR